MLLTSSPVYHYDFAKVAVMLMGITEFQHCEEEMSKFITNNEQPTTNYYNEEVNYANGMEYREV
jgi:fibrillarin-like rRNA methylase